MERSSAPVQKPSPDEVRDLRAQLAALALRLEQSELERALAVEREKSLQREVQHRVRNLLAIVRSVFSRTIESRHSVEDLRNHFRGRLDALGPPQVALAVDPHGARDLEELIRDELRSFEFDERIEVAGPDVGVPNEAVPALGLAIHELATNAIKFGALSTSDAGASLSVRWTCSENWLLLKWVEDSAPAAASMPLRRGFGREFIEDALPYQLGATTTFDLEPGRLSCSIAIQLDEAVYAAANTRSWL